MSLPLSINNSSEKLKCLFLGSLPPNIGGVSTFSFSITKELSNNINLIFYDYSHGKSKKSIPSGIYKYHAFVPKSKLKKLIKCLPTLFSPLMREKWKFHFSGIHNISIAESISIRSYFYDLYNFLSKNKVDVIHSQHPGIWTFIISKIAEDFKIPHVVTLHGTLDKFMDTPMKAEMTKSIFQTDAHIVCVSEYLKDYINLKKLSRDVKVIYHGVDTEIFENKHDATQLRKKYELENKKVILYVGWFTKKKGVLLFLSMANQILKEYEDIVFIMVGPDYGERENIENYISNNNLNDSIIVLDAQPKKIIHSFYVLSDIFVLPTYSEGFGLTLIEAMASNTAVVASKVCSIPEIIKNMETGLMFKEGSGEELVGAVKKLLNSNELSIRLASAGQKLVKDKFVWKKAAKKYLEVYNKGIDLHDRQ